MPDYKAIDAGDLAAFSEILGPGRVISGPDIADDYSHDEMTEYGLYAPDALLIAESADEVASILAYCGANLIPVTPRGSGTGLCGGAVAIRGGVLLSLERMKRIIEIDPATMTATVEPGVLLMDFIKTVEDMGLFYPPDPGEKSATLGGNVMTNAGGMRAVRFGVTRDYVLGLQVALAGGELLDLGGKTVKTSSGYNLIHLLIGSEGTLGVVTKIILKLLPAPRATVSLLIPFDSFERCIEAVPRVLASGVSPTAVEFMEREVIQAAEVYLGKKFPDDSAPAYLLIRLDGESAGSLAPAMDELTDILLDAGARDVLLADTDERKASIWDARGAFLEAIKSGTPEMDECDVVVPRNRIAEFVKYSRELGSSEGIRVMSFGHAGDGNLHIYALKDALSDEAWSDGCGRVMDALYKKARELGGQVSGEHGIGHAKSKYLLMDVGERAVGLMRGIKYAFDPNGILNPGKVV